MKRFLLGSAVLFFALIVSLPAQAQTVEERLTALEGQMANVELLSTQLFTLFSNLQPDIVAILNALATQQGEVAALQTLLAGVSRTGDTLLLTDMNLQVVSGSGDTDGTVNGKGNIIVGYDEDIFPFLGGTPALPLSDKTGSHNLIVGKGLNYSSFGGIVAGENNVSSGQYASVTGGNRNQATGEFSSVSGGQMNTASGFSSSVSGSSASTASGGFSSVSGGQENTASGDFSSVSGGISNTASGSTSSVSGGSNNAASFGEASVSGGWNNTASGPRSSVSGGWNNTASGDWSSVSGGQNRSVFGRSDWRAGALLQDN